MSLATPKRLADRSLLSKNKRCGRNKSNAQRRAASAGAHVVHSLTITMTIRIGARDLARAVLHHTRPRGPHPSAALPHFAIDVRPKRVGCDADRKRGAPPLLSDFPKGELLQ